MEIYHVFPLKRYSAIIVLSVHCFGYGTNQILYWYESQNSVILSVKKMMTFLA